MALPPSPTRRAATARLAAKGLCAGYHGHSVVRDLDLEVDAGEVVALLGPNGAGKSTTLRAISGVIPLLGGTVYLDGREPVASLHRRVRDGLGVVFEERSTFMRLTVAENLRVGRCDEELAVAIFPELAALQGRLAGALSGGEQRMLTLARALARRPSLLLADELSLGLAPIAVERIFRRLRAAADEHDLGILLVEQRARQILSYADRAYLLIRGRTALAGPVAEVAKQIEDADLAGSRVERQ